MQELSKSISSEYSNSELVFETENIQIYQREDRPVFSLIIQDGRIDLKLCDLFSFRKKILSIDIASLLTSSYSDIEIIAHCERIFVFSIPEILELRELLAGTISMLQINSVIHEKIHRVLV